MATSGNKQQQKNPIYKMVGLAGFEPASIAPEATSLDQASRQPHAAQAVRYVHL
jgi:hypothetical protein